MTRQTIALLCAALAAALIGAWLWASAAKPKPAVGLLPYTDAAALAEGKALYATQCAACHGADLAGEPNWREPDSAGFMPAPPHDENGHTWHHPDEQLFAITKLGTAAIVGGDYKTHMAGFEESLSDAQILAVLAFIKSTWPPDVIARHNQINAPQQ